jgi:branched-chain amino acid aminotransferase
MPKSYVFYQGKILQENKVGISIRCKAFNYGLGCFEGIKAFWNDKKEQLYVFRMQDHYKRLLRSCKALNMKIPYTTTQLCSWTLELLRINGFKTTTYIRPIVFKGANEIYPGLNDSDNRIAIYCLPMDDFVLETELKVMVSSWNRVTNNMIPPSAKPTGAYLNSALANLNAVQSGYNEAILLTSTGNVSEGPGENIFIYKNGMLVTPPLSDDILEGITRDTVKLLAKNDLNIKVAERSISRNELYSADEAFFTGTALGIKPIVEIDRRKIGKGHEGSVCRSIKNLYNDIAFGNNPKYKSFCTPVY